MAFSRRRFLKAGGAVAAGMLAPWAAAQAKRPNLLFIMTDQHPFGAIGAYGTAGVKTPNIDRIAAEGVRFDRFYIAAFPCSPSRASFLTGRHAHNHGVVTNDVILSDAVPSLGAALKRAGYHTGYVGKWHLTGQMYRGRTGAPMNNEWYYERVPSADGFRFERKPGGTGEDVPQHGFDYWVGGWTHYHDYLRQAGLEKFAEQKIGNHSIAASGPEGTHIYSEVPEDHHMSAFLAGNAVKFLEEQHGQDAPFGLVLSFYGPHLPVAPPRPWDTLYGLAEASLPASYPDNLEGKPVRQRTNRRCYVQPEWTADQFRDYIRRYWGYSSYIDHQIGRVLAALDASGKADDTIVVFTSDHGDMMASHGFVFKLGHCGYEELLNVPFLIRAPGRLPSGAVCDRLVSSVDVFPTLLKLLGLDAPAGLDGRDFLPAIEGATIHEHVFCNSMDNNLTVVGARWKYVLNWSPRDADELYDLENDPGEMTNLAGVEAHAETLARMRETARAWLRETGHPYAAVIEAAIIAAPDARVVDLWPEITGFNDLGGGSFEFSYQWHVEDAPPKNHPYWSFTHFTNKKYAQDGDIAFRDTTWPTPPTTEWEKGGICAVGPVRVTIPDTAGSGAYGVRIGLHDPKNRVPIGMLARGEGNAVAVGTLHVTRDAGTVSLQFVPAKRSR
ncbi:MAG TPA: sulfatase-like hydrolase/transferase [Candidatus Hydrogenedentes bacterium]|nr:sulfatase-like hydrolase/transferase [Candidatus Hydrogenedentota bacterium]